LAGLGSPLVADLTGGVGPCLVTPWAETLRFRLPSRNGRNRWGSVPVLFLVPIVVLGGLIRRDQSGFVSSERGQGWRSAFFFSSFWRNGSKLRPALGPPPSGDEAPLSSPVGDPPIRISMVAEGEDPFAEVWRSAVRVRLAVRTAFVFLPFCRDFPFVFFDFFVGPPPALSGRTPAIGGVVPSCRCWAGDWFGAGWPSAAQTQRGRVTKRRDVLFVGGKPVFLPLPFVDRPAVLSQLCVVRAPADLREL